MVQKPRNFEEERRQRAQRADLRQIKPVVARKPRGSPGMRLFLLGLLGVGAYGAYYGASVYRLGEKQYVFTRSCHDLHQMLLAKDGAIESADVRTAVLILARTAGVEPVSLKITMEPLTSQNQNKLTSTTQKALNIVGKMPNYRKPNWLVGFSGRFRVKSGPANREFEAARFTWFEGNHVASDGL